MIVARDMRLCSPGITNTAVIRAMLAAEFHERASRSSFGTRKRMRDLLRGLFDLVAADLDGFHHGGQMMGLLGDLLSELELIVSHGFRQSLRTLLKPPPNR